MLKDLIKRFSKKIFQNSLNVSQNKYKDHLFALVLAGGGGTRLWPKSREKTPKQFLKLFYNKTLTQITIERFKKILPLSKIFIVTVSEEYKKEILKEIPDFPPKNIIVEPLRRETGPAHGIGATFIKKQDPDAVIVTESADRLVDPISMYLKTLTTAAKVAYSDRLLIAVGVKPQYPHTGLGHIKKGKEYLKIKDHTFYKVEKFVEKPPLALAKKYTKSGKYYWNAGQYVWRADEYLKAFNLYEPEISKGLQKIEEEIGTSKELKTIKEVYEKFPLKTKEGKPLSVDYTVSERAKNMVCLGGDFYWSDIGDWKEVWNNLKKDENGNVIIDGEEKGGQIMNIDATDSMIHTNGRMIAIIDVDNIVVVDTKDCLLICSKSRAQNVKKIVEELKARKQKELL